MARIHVDGKEYNVNESNNLLKVCLSLGLNIPYFCWHPALGSVGACRQCAVKQYNNADDTRGRLVMSCMTPAADNTFISINDNEAREFRQSIIELLMINHPHDCPVCEEGGSCHLQDMTVMNNQNLRRYRFTKRTHYNQYLGPFISHEMNRCIACYRCVRYYQDYANGNDLGVYGAHDSIYFGRPKEGALENEFSGNLVEICPTGVFTDKTDSERYNRKWDMQFSPSICQQCSVGCNISPGERYGNICRIENRYNGSVNQYFLCDRGRFGYGYVNLKNRPKQPLQRNDKEWIALDMKQAIKYASDTLSQVRKTIGIGSPRASIESNFALRELVGAENFYAGISTAEQNRLMLILNVLRNSGIHTPSLREIESYDAILILGEDITQTGARIALAVRQAIKGKALEMAAKQKISDWQIAAIMNVGQHAKCPLFITNVDRTQLDDIVSWSYYASVDDQARLGFAIAHALDNTAPEVSDLDDLPKDKISMAVQALASARKPLIISGSNAGSESVIAAAANVARALKGRNSEVGIVFVAADANSLGLAMIGGGSLDDALIKLEHGMADGVIVLENDLYRHAPAACINNALMIVKKLIVLDHQYNYIQEKANLILPAASFAEGNGTLVNYEGRAQRFFKVYDPSYYDNNVLILESWRWLHSLYATYFNRQVEWTKLDHIIDAIAKILPQLAGIKQAAPNASFRIYGQKIARQPHRYSGRTAMRANINVHEQRVPQDHDTMLTFSMEGYSAPQAPCQQIAFAWVPGWNSSQAWNKFQDEVGGHLRYGDPGMRLLEASNMILVDWFNNIPPVFKPAQDGSWRVAPYWHLFGSEEMSQRSLVFQERMPAPYVIVSQKDAVYLGCNSGSSLTFSCAGQELCLPVKFSDVLSPGQIGLPLGLPGIPPMLAGLQAENLREKVL